MARVYFLAYCAASERLRCDARPSQRPQEAAKPPPKPVSSRLALVNVLRLLLAVRSA